MFSSYFFMLFYLDYSLTQNYTDSSGMSSIKGKTKEKLFDEKKSINNSSKMCHVLLSKCSWHW